MSVIINEFEITPAPLAPPANTAEEAPPQPSPQSRAQEVERLIRRQTERQLRLLAH